MQPKSGRGGVLFATLLGILLVAVGCRPTVTPDPPPPFAGVQLRVLCGDTATETIVTDYSRGWQGRQKAQVKAVKQQPGEVNASDYDVLIIRPADLPALASQQKLQPLPEEYTSREHPLNWAGLLPVYRDSLL